MHRLNPDETALHAYQPRVTIHSGASGVTPLFCIPGAGASVSSFYELSQTLSVHIPMHGMQARGLDGELAPYADVASAAQAYLHAIREVQPHGPYHLLGHSFGGWIAFELALLLVAQGELVANLVIVDSRAPNDADDAARPHGRIPTLLKLIELYEMRLDQPLALTARHFVGLSAEQQIALLHQALVKAGIFYPKTQKKILDGVVQVMDANLATRYAPSGHFAGAVQFISAQEGDALQTQQRIDGWRRYVGTLEHLQISGNHVTMLSLPHVAALGSLLNEWLEVAQGVGVV
ncbi:thioesterase domain-containing protein [Andreprevotia chitinilytica]|uniref:thioesterase domain-containing protein n=1 Tax=Andreprevotia chitinilytica TaxID=396808 RepID=UPI0005555185|nr:alpha/beta fold hydrolase [Andreprevotia chitinilytica]